MAGPALFFGVQRCGVLLKIRAHIGLSHGDGLLDGVQVKHQILHIHRFWRLEHGTVGLVKAIYIGVCERDFFRKICGLEACNLHIAVFKKRVQGHIRHPLGRKRGPCQPALHLPHRNILPHAGFKTIGRQALAGNQLAVALHVKLAVGFAQGGNGRNLFQLLRQARVADLEVRVGQRFFKHHLAHQALQRFVARLRRLQHFCVQARHGCAQAVHFVFMGGVPLRLGNAAAGHFGNGRTVIAHATVAIDPHKHKGGDDQQEHQHHHDFGVLAYEVKHALSPNKNKKGELGSSPLLW